MVVGGSERADTISIKGLLMLHFLHGNAQPAEPKTVRFQGYHGHIEYISGRDARMENLLGR